MYKAHRKNEADIHQKGALKIIHKSLITPLHTERFRLEQQILSGIQHPNIAGFIDSGITTDGIPYMVMEYVEGESLLEYCDNHKLPVSKRLGLFKTVCRTIQFAHKSLIVHRDLKPENILVTEDGHVKILDFGIAKLLDPNLYELSPVETQPGLRMLSLEYASPEQVAGKPVTTATDVYSLGILLYRLLTGLHPFEVNDHSFREVEKMVLDKDPPLLSHRFSNFKKNGKQTEIAQNRGLDVSELTHQLKGDLDAIANKALQKNPERRYESAETFNTDLERYQSGLPISARPDTFGYRSAKFISRHRWVVTAAVLIILSLGVGIVATLWQAKQAQKNAEEALLEAQKSKAVKDFLIDVFQVSDPNLSLGETVTAKELLDQGATRIEDDLSNQPEIQAEMLGVMGEVYQQLGLLDKADELLKQSLRQQRALEGADSLSIAGALNRLAILRYNQGEFEEAIRLLEKVLTIRTGHPKTNIEELSEAQNNLATLYMENGQYALADSLLRLAIDIRRTFVHPAGLAESLNTLALIHYDQANLDEAETLYEEVLTLENSFLEPGHPSLVETRHNLAQLYWAQGKLDEAEPLFQDVIDIDRRVYGDDHPTVALDLNSLALVLMDNGNFDEAEVVYREAIAIQETSYGEEHPDLTATYYNLGSMYSFTGEYNLAEPLLRKALVGDKKLFDERHPNVGIDMASLAGVLISLKKYDEAESLLNEALSIFEDVFPEDHPRIASVEIRMGQLAYEQGEYEKAETLLSKSLPVAEATFNTPWKTAGAKSSLGLTLLAQGRVDEAKPLLAEANLALSQVFTEKHSVLLATRNALQTVGE